MNPLTNMKNVLKLSEQELTSQNKSSWHDQYKGSAWIFVGGLPYDLTEGDIICIFSQYGEVVNINLIRAKDTGKSKGFCFLCYEDQRSTVLAVDNFNGIKILNRTIRVDHVQEYKVPKEGKKTDDETKKLYAEGCAPQAIAPPKVEQPKHDVRETIADQIEGELKLPARLPIYTTIKEEPFESKTEKTKLKREKKKKSKKSKKKKSKRSSSEDESSSDSDGGGKRLKDDRGNIYSDKDNNKNKYSKEKTNRDDKNRYGRSRSKERDREDKYRNYKKDASPNIPKRWR